MKLPTFRTIALTLLTGFLLVGAPQLTLAQTTWTGAGVDDNWFNFANWDTATVPNGVATDVTVGAPSPVTVNGNVDINSLMVGIDGVLNQADNRSFEFGGAATTTLNNMGTINVGNNSSFQLSGTVNNSGGISANYAGGSVNSDIEVTSGGATLSGGGLITLNGSNARIMGLSGATIDLGDQMVQGGGQVGANSLGITIGSGGMIDANLAATTMIFDSSSAGATNNGIMQASNGGTLRISGSNISNASGSIQALVGSNVDLNSNTSITGGFLSGAGTFNVLDSQSVFLTDVAHSSTMNVGNNTDLGVTGTINNSGSISMNYTGGSVNTDIEVQTGTGILTGGGTVTLNGANARIMGLSGTSVTIDDQTVQGGGQIGANTLGITNSSSGLIDANVSGVTMTIDSSTAGVTNDGVMRASNGGTLQITGSDVNNTNGSIQALASSNVDLRGNTSITGGILSGAGTFNVLANENVFLTDVNHSSTMEVANNTDLGVTGTINNSGSISLNYTGGSVNSDMVVQTGTAMLTGGGTVTLNGPSARITGLSGTSITIGDQTIQGGGQIGANFLGITNSASGLIDANVATGTMTVDSSSAGGVVNNGVMRASNGGTLRISGSNVDNMNGSIQALAGSNVDLTVNTSITGGVLSGAGTFNAIANENVFLTDVTHSSTMEVANNTDLGVTGTINNSGAISMNYTGGSVNSDMEVQTGTAILTGGGTVTLNGNNARIMGLSGTSVTIDDQTVQGGGQIGANTLGITNSSSGLIHANVSATTMTIDASGAGAVNDGVMRASNGGTLRISGSSVDNTNGAIVANGGSIIEITNNTSISGGHLAGAGTFNVLASQNVFLADVTHSSTMEVGNNTDLGVTGTINNTGFISLNYTGGSVNSDMEVQAGDALLTGGGTVTLNGGNARINGVSGATITIDNQTVNGRGNIGGNDISVINNTLGIIDANVAGQTLTIDPVGSSTVDWTSQGTLRASNGGVLDSVHNLINDGIIDVETGSIVRANSIVSTAGSLITGDGMLDSDLDTISIEGIVAPGNSPGTLTFDGDTMFGSTAVLQVEIASDSLFDQLVVMGDLALDGTLDVAFLGAYLPGSGDVFQIVETDPASSLSGVFSNAADGDMLMTSDGLGTFVVNYVGDTVQLSGFQASVPEPGSAVLLLVIGLTGMTCRRRRS